VLGERKRHPLTSRFGRGRVDLKHAWLDPLLVLGPWLVAGGLVFMLIRAGVRGVSAVQSRRRAIPRMSLGDTFRSSVARAREDGLVRRG
jgi:hypothetical protein